MDSMNGTDPYGSSGSSSSSKAMQKISQRYRYFLDKTTPHTAGRWLALLGLLVIYGVRVYLLKGDCSLSIMEYGLVDMANFILRSVVHPHDHPHL